MWMRLNNQVDPFRELRDLQRRMDEVFFNFLPDHTRKRQQGGTSRAGFNVFDRGESYLVEAELPGMSQEDLKIEATANSLSITGKRNASAPEGYTVHRRERSGLEFARSFTFPAKIDVEKVSASLKNGVLTLELAKQAEERPRQIAIKGAA